MTDSVHILMLVNLERQAIVGVFRDKQEARRYRNEWEDYLNVPHGEIDAEFRKQELTYQIDKYETVDDIIHFRSVQIVSEPVR